jgi:hypothetical protein
MLERRPSRRRITLGADKAYGVRQFVKELRERKVTPHIALDGHLSKTGKPRVTAKIAGSREQHGIPQGGFVFDPTILLDRHRGCDKRQPLPPVAAPAFLPTHNRIERADGGARHDCNVLNLVPCKVLRIGDGTAQPCRDGERRRGGCRGRRAGVARERVGAQNHCERT